MSRVIYSLYIDISEDDLDFFDKNIIKKDQTPTNINTKNQFKEHYSKIIDNKKRYADNIGVDFHLHENDKDFKYYVEYFKTHFPFITMYNIVNFYKLELMNNYLADHDEVLYLDFDAMPVTKDNFFEVWDLSNGIAVYNNNKNIRPTHMPLDMVRGTIRSPSAKYFNAMAMLEENNMSPQCDVINTGIIGSNKEHWKKLDYWGGLVSLFDLMHYLRSDTYAKDSMYPKNITDTFGYDNETIFSYKLKENDVPVQWLNSQWHYFYDTELHIPKETKIVHAINKEFDYVWRFEKKINL
tara:strand:- start:3562 stop:4449 length:888 start_codon:yes stop_codon:yes gene_type:complete